MILAGSRYANAPVISVPDADGVLHPTIYYSTRFPAGGSFYYHSISFGDRLDTLAQNYYNDSELWWIIANANPELFYPDSLDVGTTIRIPVSSS